jgi:hypothetical protein
MTGSKWATWLTKKRCRLVLASLRDFVSVCYRQSYCFSLGGLSLSEVRFRFVSVCCRQSNCFQTAFRFIFLASGSTLSESSVLQNTQNLFLGAEDRLENRRQRSKTRPQSADPAHTQSLASATQNSKCVGRWIKGSNTWAISSRPNRHAVRLIRERIQARAMALQRELVISAARLYVYRKKHLVCLRRDVQRLLLMESGRPPVAAGTLHVLWYQQGADESWASMLRRTPSLAACRGGA